MALIDAVVDGQDERSDLAAMAHARLDYLFRRAEARYVAEHAEDWDPRMAEATLWMEACETACFIGLRDQARQALQRATERLVALRNPFGESLQEAFLPRRRIEETGFLVGAARRADGQVEPWALFNWLSRPYAGRIEDEGTERPDSGLRTGRLGWTLDELMAVADWSRSASERGAAGQTDPGVFFALQLTTRYAALRRARRNSHLWQRMLAPVPLFDLELAVLIRHGLITQVGAFVQQRPLADLGDERQDAFAQAYVDAVAALVSTPGDGGLVRDVRVVS
jgi:hypothetical protein